MTTSAGKELLLDDIQRIEAPEESESHEHIDTSPLMSLHGDRNHLPMCQFDSSEIIQLIWDLSPSLHLTESVLFTLNGPESDSRLV